MIIALKENKSKTKIRTDIFLFRNPKNAEKFKQAQKLSWKENEDEKIGYMVKLLITQILRFWIFQNY